MSVLVVEDDAAIRRSLIAGLTERAYAVETVSSGLPALESVVTDAPDVVVLDLGLPDIDGLSLVPMIRAVSAVPIVVVTARDDDHDLVRALDAGADDYVVKPFGIEHLAARLRAVLRRAVTPGPEGPLVVGELSIDAGTRVARLGDRVVDLAPKEFDLLLVLASRQGQVVTKRELLAEVWQQPYGSSERSVDVHLSWLRRKLGETAQRPRYLRTVHGVGIRLVDPSEEAPGP